MCFCFTLEFRIYLELSSVFVGINTCPCWICYECVQFQIEIFKKLAVIVHVLQTTQNSVISRCCFVENSKKCTCLLLTEFEGRTVSYTDQVYSPSIYGPSAKRAGHESKGKKQGSVTYDTDRENEVSEIFCISIVCLTRSGTISIHAARLQISDAPRKQNESIWNRC